MVDKQIYKVNAIFSNEKKQSVFESLYFYDDNISYKEIIIKGEDIKNIDMSMCSSQASTDGKYHLYTLNYYVDFIISTTDNQIFYFQIMNDSVILETFKWIKDNHIAYNDKLKIEEIFITYIDDVARSRYIERNFRNWAKEFNLDNPRENYLDSIADGFANTLQGANMELLEKANFLDKLKELNNKSKK